MWFLTVGVAVQALLSGLLLEEDRVEVPVGGIPEPKVLPSGVVLFTDSVSEADLERALRSFHEAPDNVRRRYPLYGIVLSTNSDKIAIDSSFRSELSAVSNDLCFVYFFASENSLPSVFRNSDHALAVYPLTRLLDIRTVVLPGIFIYDDSGAILDSASARKAHSVYIPIRDIEFKTIVWQIRQVCDTYRERGDLADVASNEWRRSLKEKITSGAKAVAGPLSKLGESVAEGIGKGLVGS